MVVVSAAIFNDLIGCPCTMALQPKTFDSSDFCAWEAIRSEAIRRATGTFERDYIAEAIAPIAKRRKPPRLRELCDAAVRELHEELRKTPGAITIERLATNIASVAQWMEPPAAADACDKVGRSYGEN